MSESKVQQVAVERAVQLLRASGASFKVIWFDKEYGELEVKPVKPAKGNGTHRAKAEAEGRKYGDLKNHYWPVVQGLSVGEVVVVPFGTFRKDTLQKAVSSGLCHLWGSGSNITSLSDAGVEVLRVK